MMGNGANKKKLILIGINLKNGQLINERKIGKKTLYIVNIFKQRY